jgi:hypothetical protein
MSTTQFSFKAKVRVGEQIIPLFSEVTIGSGEAENGVQNGFIFRLDLQPGDGPVLVNLGEMIALIEDKLGAGPGKLRGDPKVKLLAQAFPDYIGDGGQPFDKSNDTQIQIKSFELNSSEKEFLFSFNVDVTSTDPTTGLITLPPALASWIRIDNLAISFSASKPKSSE